MWRENLRQPGQRKNRVILFTDVTLLYILLWSYAGYAIASGNFHTITPGEAYRSAQLNRSQLHYYTDKYKIKSILNLRGKNSQNQWYVDEVRFSAEHNITHYDVALSATREPTPEETVKILDIFQHAPRPILIHCKAGADRSGLVSAMWKVVVDNESKNVADNQLSILYGHVTVGGTIAMDRYFHSWRPPY
ncbi:MAG: dual specificity protein phosphatase family protein [Nitrospirae bacterium]|nr:dual specificity protein phosphatase family protein [Nitrospirota bacterium]